MELEGFLHLIAGYFLVFVLHAFIDNIYLCFILAVLLGILKEMVTYYFFKIEFNLYNVILVALGSALIFLSFLQTKLKP